jgi:hypothetical protein
LVLKVLLEQQAQQDPLVEPLELQVQLVLLVQQVQQDPKEPQVTLGLQVLKVVQVILELQE